MSKLKLNCQFINSETAISTLQHFFTAYSFRSSNIQLNRALSTIVRGNYSGMTDVEKAELFDYFMALEELLPALYELKERLDKPEESTYRDEVSAKQIYAACKRHPE